MKRLMSCLLATIGLLPACNASPDEDTMGELRQQVANFPGDLKIAMAKWAANRVAYGYMLSKRHDTPIGYIDCPNAGRFPLFVRDMLDCLTRHQTSSYEYCFNFIMDDFYNNSKIILPEPCSVTHLPEFAPENMPDDFKAERITEDQIAWGMLGISPPPREIQIMLLGLPGLMGPKGFLCVQGADWACAPNPLDDTPSTTGSSSTGGGDR